MVGDKIEHHLHTMLLNPFPEPSQRFFSAQGFRDCVTCDCKTRPDGEWKLLTCFPAWEGNPTNDNFIAFSWKYMDKPLLVLINYADHQGQCYIETPLINPDGRIVSLHDLYRDVVYERDGAELINKGLYIDLPAWDYHVFEMKFSSPQ